MNKQQFIDEIAKRGVIDLDKIPYNPIPGAVYLEWYEYGDYVGYKELIDYPNKRRIKIYGTTIRNPPTQVSDIYFQGAIGSGWGEVDELPTDWLLTAIDMLPQLLGPHATLHVSLPTDEKTNAPIANAKAYICTNGGKCSPGELLGVVPLDITFGDTLGYKLGTVYTIVIRACGYIWAHDNHTFVVDEERTFSPKLCSCSSPTTHYASGRELVEHYDDNNDGAISMDDMLVAIRDYSDGKITIYENHAVIEAWVNSFICPTTITFSTKKADGSELTGVDVYIGGAFAGIT